MKILVLKKTYQAYDSDAWQHWPEKSIISYHLTMEGLIAKRDTLLQEEIEKITNGTYSDESYRVKVLSLLANNEVSILHGTCSEEGEDSIEDYYTASEIEVLD